MIQSNKIKGLLLFFTSIVLLLVIGCGQLEVEPVEDKFQLSNFAFFVLVNLNILIIMVLGFLVVKNIVKLVLDRRRQILGSRLKTRLVAAFVGLSLVPTIMLFLVAKGILGTVLEGWFAPQVAASVDGALAIAKYHYDELESRTNKQAHYLVKELSRRYPFLLLSENTQRKEAFELVSSYLADKREEYSLFEIVIIDPQGNIFAKARVADSAGLPQVEYPSEKLKEILAGTDKIVSTQATSGEFLQSYVAISPHYILAITHWMLPDFEKTLEAVVNAYDDYKELGSYRRPLASSYLLSLVGVTLMIIFAAVWVGFYLARSLTVPIMLLAEGTNQVAEGNLEYRIPEVGDDELSTLVHSFNVMTEDLKRTNGELISRRRYMETVLASVGVGVISVDTCQVVTTFNKAAAEILGLEKLDGLLGYELKKSTTDSAANRLSEIVDELYHSREKVIISSLSLVIQGQSKHINTTITKLVDESGKLLGSVILLDDLTELVRAQRTAAWREVARRIAHEIKNPLTPIQLSAQRLQKKFSNEPMTNLSEDLPQSDREVIAESTEIIIKQVETLRSLVNEFSRFARMPKNKPQPVNLNTVIMENVLIFSQAHQMIAFSFNLDQNIPTLIVDQEQIGRALINLIDNAVSSVKSKFETLTGGQIVVSSKYDNNLGLVSVAISDNGFGVDDRDKSRLFEPYFSKRKGGTGLGLAIVSSIVADHNGFIRVRDNKPSGVIFIIELPVDSKLVMQGELRKHA